MKLSIIQTNASHSGNSLSGKLQFLDNAAEQAAAEQADILITPEMFLTGYNIGAPAVRAAAETPEGHMLECVAELATKHRIAILVGFPELADDGTIYNSAAFIGADGHTLSVYRKTHLFGEVDRAQFTAGSDLPSPFIYQGWRLSIAICYDIEFPEVARFYAKSGADALLVPTANMAPFFSVAQQMVPVRAQENVIYIAYANFVGDEGEFNYCGLSCICDPLGEDIARADSDNEALIFGTLSRQKLQEARKLTPYLKDLRNELYGSGEHNNE